MPEVWQTIEQAAVTLGLSVRTVNRHITGGKLPSRLYEGRREVLVALQEPVRKTEVSAAASNPVAPGRGGNAHAPPFDDVTHEATYPSESGGSPSRRPSDSDPSPPKVPSDSRESSRQTVTAQVATDKPLDVQTMLALADSVDDKATLAIAAYQTLARSSETQVQSLRRVAFGAWAVVGLMAIGIILAVGWVTHRWTTAEVQAANLGEKVSEQTNEIGRLAADRDKTRAELRDVNEEASKMARDLKEVTVQAARQQAEAADTVKFALQRMQETRPTIPPTTHPAVQPTTTPSANPWITTGAPATRPSLVVTPLTASRPSEVGVGGPFLFANPASRPAHVPGLRSPPQANTDGALGPR